MDIKEFVKKVLSDVVFATSETEKDLGREIYLTNTSEQRTVEFDIAVTVEKSTESSGEAGVKVLTFIDLSGEKSNTLKNSSISRVKFGVNVSSKSLSKQQEISFAKNTIINTAL